MEPQRDRAGTVLVVEPDEDVRDRIGEWLEGEGFEVAGCPGPLGPDYSCVGSRSWMCPLERDADVVVLDLALASDLAMEGTPSEELLAYYVWKGHHVVALAHGVESLRSVDRDQVAVIPLPPTRAAVVAAVRTFVPEVTAGS